MRTENFLSTAKITGVRRKPEKNRQVLAKSEIDRMRRQMDMKPGIRDQNVNSSNRFRVSGKAIKNQVLAKDRQYLKSKYYFIKNLVCLNRLKSFNYSSFGILKESYEANNGKYWARNLLKI